MALLNLRGSKKVEREPTLKTYEYRYDIKYGQGQGLLKAYSLSQAKRFIKTYYKYQHIRHLEIEEYYFERELAYIDMSFDPLRAPLERQFISHPIDLEIQETEEKLRCLLAKRKKEQSKS